jgi:hypothetical protein
MIGKTIKCLLGMFLVIMLLSCQKIPEPGNFGMEVLKLGSAIPLSWGNLISVTSVDENTEHVQLWFQDKEGNIYLSVYNVAKNRFSPDYRFMKRI